MAVPPELISWGNATDLHDLGGGLAFGTKALPHVQEFFMSHLQSVPLQLRKDVVLFDWWVQLFHLHFKREIICRSGFTQRVQEPLRGNPTLVMSG